LVEMIITKTTCF